MTKGERKDFFHLLSFLSPARLFNIIKLILSYYHSVFYKKIWMWGLPWSVSIEPNNNCNLHCPECPTGINSVARRIGMISPGNFEALLHNLPDTIFFVNLYFLGESLLHPGIMEMISKLKEKNIYVSLSSNAQLLTKEVAKQLVKAGLDRLIISMDGYDQHSYEKYRIGGDFQKVIEAFSHVIQARKEVFSSRPFLILQTLLLKSTEDNLDRVKELSSIVGADKLELKTAWFDVKGKQSLLHPEKSEHSRYYQDEAGNWQIKSKLPDKCFRMWTSAVITWQGDVVPCCFDKDVSHKKGNCIKKPLREIWRGPEYNAFRKQIVNNRSEIEMCRNCTEGLSRSKRS